jgi:dUTPase
MSLAINESIMNRAKKYTTPFAILKLCVPDSLKVKYSEAILKHNEKMEKNQFPDAGFDLYLPDDFIFTNSKGKIDMQVNCEMLTINHSLETANSNIVEIVPTAFYLMPRSSISKKPLMMANSIGLIDSGYRGNIQAVFRYFEDEHNDGDNSGPYKLEKYERIVQIVHPCTYRIFVELVDFIEDLTTTERKDGGFGSTGV